MRLTFSPEINNLLDLVRGELTEGQNLYLVGGAVRDACLDRKINDLDFAMCVDPTGLAKKVAKRLKMGFFVLDDVRHTARVLYRTAEGKLSPLDFVKFTGEDLQEDLRNRDFTINAMAVSLKNLEQVIDPLDGQADLSKRLLRLCSDHSLLDDPVRILRGIRLAQQFNLDFHGALPAMMHDAAGYLRTSSYERQRDEFFKILEGPDPARGMDACREFRVFESLIPPLIEQEEIPASPPHTLPLFDHTIAVVGFYNELLDRIQSGEPAREESPWWLTFAVSELSPFSDEIETFFAEEITLGRSKQGLALFGSLLHDIGKPLTIKVGKDDRYHYYGHARVGADLAWDAARRLQLSNAEAAWIKTMVRGHMDLLPLVNKQEALKRQAIYRFFNETEDVGVAVALLSMADFLATYGEMLPHEKWERTVKVTKRLFAAWWKQQETLVSPDLLLDGNDLQNEFGLAPGKQIGQLLEALREAQAVGRVTSLAEAKAFIHSQLEHINKG